MATSAEIFRKVRALGMQILPPPVPNGGYDLVSVHRGLAYVSGQLPRTGTGPEELMAGRILGEDDIPRAQEAARLCLLRSVFALHYHLGDLATVKGLVSIRGFLNAAPDFGAHAKVMDAASALARELFGPAGGHVRSALGAGSLPSQALVEVELVAELGDTHAS
ncbi:RidA family protein [Pigmentiphaga soli]|uniref:RidA family protein n=1 Tax=Pigmentiphaga soli TaxID=1007095 RepID=A0ABP8GTG8_9BURK